METKFISPKKHSLIDYALASSLVVLPSVLGFNHQVKKLYTSEGIILLIYVALTDHPACVKPLIPFPVHGKIDPFNIAQFALQTFFKPFRKDKKAQIFNIGFTVIAGLTVLFTDWNGRTEKHNKI